MKEPHFLSVLLLGMSASLWAVIDNRFTMPLLWLLTLGCFVLLNKPDEILLFFRRFLKIGLALLGMSALQIVFRRSGDALVSVRDFPLVYSDGLREAGLLWVRFMILFALAFVMARVSMFQFLFFSNKLGLSLNFCLLLLNTLKQIPAIFTEAKRALWFMRFRGVRFRSLSLPDKLISIRQLVYSLLMRSVENMFLSAHVLELRGYGQTQVGKIKASFPIRWEDGVLVGLVVMLNLFGVIINWFN